MKRDETMQNMNYYYDFSGQKFEYPYNEVNKKNQYVMLK